MKRDQSVFAAAVALPALLAPADAHAAEGLFREPVHYAAGQAPLAVAQLNEDGFLGLAAAASGSAGTATVVCPHDMRN